MNTTSTSMVGTQTLGGVTLPNNPPYTSSWRDGSSTHKLALDTKDLFRPDVPRATPWVAEQRLQFQAPDKYTNRVCNMTIVHTGGNTDMAHVTHHTVRAACNLTGTIYRGLDHDAAFDEEVFVSQEVVDQMPAVLEACDKYHLHAPDGWITTAGFVVCARKAGLDLTRAQFLAIERAVPKDTLGRVHYQQIMAAVQRLVKGEPPARPVDTFSTSKAYNAVVVP